MLEIAKTTPTNQSIFSPFFCSSLVGVVFCYGVVPLPCHGVVRPRTLQLLLPSPQDALVTPLTAVSVASGATELCNAPGRYNWCSRSHRAPLYRLWTLQLLLLDPHDVAVTTPHAASATPRDTGPSCIVSMGPPRGHEP